MKKSYFILLISIIILISCITTNKINQRVYSLNKGYSIVLPENWIDLKNKEVFQIGRIDDTNVLSASLILMPDTDFGSFCNIRYNAVDSSLWSYSKTTTSLFNLKYDYNSKLYEGSTDKTRHLYYLVNCIGYGIYYLSLTFVIEKESYDKSLLDIQFIFDSLKFHIR